MKKILLTAALVALSSISANAADLGARPYTKAPMMDPAYDWSGFYIGVNAGYGWARNDHQDLGGNSSYWNDKSDVQHQVVNPRGAVYGGQIGYNWQAANWVFGLEGQFNGADIKRTDLNINYPDDEFLRSKIDSVATVTARVGYAFNNWLPYIKGGYAAAHLETKDFQLDNTYLSNSAWRSGYVVGAGLEYAFAANWIFGVEYNYMDFGEKTFTGVTYFPSGSTHDEHFNDTLKLSTVTARLSYKFGSGVAKY